MTYLEAFCFLLFFSFHEAMACSWCSVWWSFEMSFRDLHAEVGWDASQSFAFPVTQKAAARYRWLGSPGSQAMSFCCNCSCFPRSAPRELSLPRTPMEQLCGSERLSPTLCITVPWVPSTPWETTNVERSSSSKAAQLGLLLISEIFVEILQWICPIVIQNISLPSSSNSKGLTWGGSPRLIAWAL